MQNNETAPTYHVTLSDGQKFSLCLDLKVMTLATYQRYRLASTKFEHLHSKEDDESLIELAAARVELMQVLAPEIDWANHPDLFNDDVNQVIRMIIDLIVEAENKYKNINAKAPKFGAPELEINGETYTLPLRRALHYLELVPAITANEFCEVMTMKEEYERLLKSANPVQLHEGKYQLSMKQFAVLYRKEGEALPLDTAERKAFIDQRARLFESAPASFGLDSDFFLTGIASEYALSSLQSLNLQPTTSKAKKRKAQAQGKNNSQKRKAGTMYLAKSPRHN